jgi:hypothetical protein
MVPAHLDGVRIGRLSQPARAMLHLLLVVAFLSVAGSSSLQASDLSDLRVVRSLLAESALVIRFERRGSLTGAYGTQMKDLIGDELRERCGKKEGPASQWSCRGLKELSADDEAALNRTQGALSHLVDLREKSD